MQIYEDGYKQFQFPINFFIYNCKNENTTILALQFHYALQLLLQLQHCKTAKVHPRLALLIII